MFALRDGMNWPLDQIAAGFGLHPGSVSRCVDEVERELRIGFRPADEDEDATADTSHDDA